MMSDSGTTPEGSAMYNEKGTTAVHSNTREMSLWFLNQAGA